MVRCIAGKLYVLDLFSRSYCVHGYIFPFNTMYISPWIESCLVLKRPVLSPSPFRLPPSPPPPPPSLMLLAEVSEDGALDIHHVRDEDVVKICCSLPILLTKTCPKIPKIYSTVFFNWNKKKIIEIFKSLYETLKLGSFVRGKT